MEIKGREKRPLLVWLNEERTNKELDTFQSNKLTGKKMTERVEK